MSLGFLKSQRVSLLVGRIAVLFHSCMTPLIISLLVAFLFWDRLYFSFLEKLLAVDVAFIVTHLMYRTLYSGPTSVQRKKKRVLIVVHGVTSLLALVCTYGFLLNLENVTLLAWVSLAMWTFSFGSGVIFFSKKYYSISLSDI